jgi:hypothetical protein
MLHGLVLVFALLSQLLSASGPPDHGVLQATSSRATRPILVIQGGSCSVPDGCPF